MKRILVFLALGIFSVGCYTQVAVREKVDDTYTYKNSEFEQEYSEGVEYDTVYYDETDAEYQERYEGLEDKVVNDYYFDGYTDLPSTSITLRLGGGYYDPFWYNWDYFWYVNSWYSPRYYFDGFSFGYYWNPYPYNNCWYPCGYPYYYDNYYYGGYYSGNGGYVSKVHPGKTRDNDGNRKTRDDRKIRTSDIGGGSFSGTNRNDRTIDRNIKRQKEDSGKRVVYDRKKLEDNGISSERIRIQRENIKNDSENRKIIVKDRDNIKRDYQPKLDGTQNRTNQDKIDKNTNTNTGNRQKVFIKRNNTDTKTNTNNRQNYSNPPVKQKTGNNTRVDDNNTKKNDYKPPVNQKREYRNDSPPVKEYRQSPPTNNNSNNSPPVNSGNSRSNSGGGSRNSGNRGSR